MGKKFLTYSSIIVQWCSFVWMKSSRASVLVIDYLCLSVKPACGVEEEWDLCSPFRFWAPFLGRESTYSWWSASTIPIQLLPEIWPSFPGKVRVLGLKARQTQFPLHCSLREGFKGVTGFSARQDMLQGRVGGSELETEYCESLCVGKKLQQRISQGGRHKEKGI